MIRLIRVPSEATGGASKIGVGVIVARAKESRRAWKPSVIFWFGIPFRGRGPSNVKDDFDRHELLNTPIGPGDHLLALLFGRMNAESLFASEAEAKRQTLVRL